MIDQLITSGDFLSLMSRVSMESVLPVVPTGGQLAYRMLSLDQQKLTCPDRWEAPAGELGTNRPITLPRSGCPAPCPSPRLSAHP